VSGGFSPSSRSQFLCARALERTGLISAACKSVAQRMGITAATTTTKKKEKEKETRSSKSQPSPRPPCGRSNGHERFDRQVDRLSRQQKGHFTPPSRVCLSSSSSSSSPSSARRGYILRREDRLRRGGRPFEAQKPWNYRDQGLTRTFFQTHRATKKQRNGQRKHQ